MLFNLFIISFLSSAFLQASEMENQVLCLLEENINTELCLPKTPKRTKAKKDKNNKKLGSKIGFSLGDSEQMQLELYDKGWRLEIGISRGDGMRLSLIHI